MMLLFNVSLSQQTFSAAMASLVPASQNKNTEGCRFITFDARKIEEILEIYSKLQASNEEPVVLDEGVISFEK